MYVLVKYKEGTNLGIAGSLLVKYFPDFRGARNCAVDVYLSLDTVTSEICEDHELGEKLAEYFAANQADNQKDVLVSVVEPPSQREERRGCSYENNCTYTADECPYLKIGEECECDAADSLSLAEVSAHCENCKEKSEDRAPFNADCCFGPNGDSTRSDLSVPDDDDGVVDAIWLDDDPQRQTMIDHMIEVIAEVVDLEALRAFLKADPGTVFSVTSEGGQNGWALGDCRAGVLAEAVSYEIAPEDLLALLGDIPEENRGSLLDEEGALDLGSLIDYALDHGDPEVHLAYLRETLLTDASNSI